MEQREAGQARLQILVTNRPELTAGIVLVLSSFLMPLVCNVVSFGVSTSLFRALRTAEKMELMVAAMRLVALNAIRCIPHYVGSFFIGESLEFRRGEHSLWHVNALLVLGILQLTYAGIDSLHHIHYDFGIPAILLSCCVLIFEKLGYRYISLLKKTQLIVMFLTAFQFLDVMPSIKRFPVGRGELSWDVKQAAAVLDAEDMLNTAAMAGLLIFLIYGFLSLIQLRDENALRELNVLREQNHAIRVQAQINEMKNRTNQEVQYLVHDLKSPLTAVQALVGVIKMECEAEERSRDVEYLTRIEGAVEQMSRMISEILYEDQRTVVTVEQVLKITLAQSSVSDYASFLRVEDRVPHAQVSVNRVLFPRALVNLMQNSAEAIPEGREPEISLQVDRRREGEEDRILFTVTDNGKGIGALQQEKIWDRGVSGRDSSGLGLTFVRNVVDRMGGEIRMESTRGSGTSISIILKEEGTQYE